MKKLYTKGLAQKDNNGGITVVVSDESIDRAGDSLAVGSWDFTNFSKAPRMFVDHEYSIKSLTGLWKDWRVEGKQVKMTPVFHEITELARVNKQMVEQGFLNTVSVGYIPHKKADGSYVYELLEVSWVGVPCNANARVESLSIKDIDGNETDAIKSFCEEHGLKDVEGDVKAPVAGDVCTMEDGSEGVMTDDGNGNLSCQMKAATETDKKGLIDDVNSANQALRDEKWPMLCAVWCLFDSFWCAWMSDATTPDQFAAMLSDLSGSLLALQDGTAAIDEMTDDDEGEFMLSIQGAVQKIKAFRASNVEAGKEVSAEKRDIILAAIDSIESGTCALKGLHAQAKAQSSDAGESTSERSKPAVFGGKEDLKAFAFQRRVLQEINTLTGNVLAEMRKKLSN